MTTYQEIRSVGKELHTKLLDRTQHLDFHPIRIAKRMTLPVVGRTLVFDDESEQNAYFDFWMHEYRVNGKSMAESVDLEPGPYTPLEIEILQAHRESRTSLFEAVTGYRAERQIGLRDLLEPERGEIRLTDFGLSDTLHRVRTRRVMFTRLVTVRQITMTSGFTFSFEPARAPGILQAYGQKMKKVPAEQLAEERFIFFFRKHRQFGVEQRYQDVV